MMALVELKRLDHHIALVKLNRSDAANALSKALLDELNVMIDRVNQDKTIHCVIVTGSGEKAFCAGADLKERRGMSDDQVIETVSYIGKTISKLEAMEVPVIAALNGVAFGGGLELALACDIRIAADDIKLGLTETSLAIIPGAGGTQRLPRLIGLGRAKQLIYTAKAISAEQALTYGIVEEIISKNDLLEATISLAKSIAKNGPIALRMAKSAINQGMQVDLPSGLVIEHECYKQTIPTKDRVEGLEAFREKRLPVYRGE
ncbi:enoyl-CoA hydratase [Ornithinibacillus bavariensis]|uniref:enoyl-CoA hydratase n=1 Tax=Ornithinibacillus bavariensis TaxID=545502 RepID=UPI000EE62EA4|nr:enoyl-CoA hydratase [Ornithinibacillus sp.]